MGHISQSSQTLPDENHRRKRYQQGSVMHEVRGECMHTPRHRCATCVWVYRYFTDIAGKRVRRKAILGTIAQLPTRDDAKRASEHLRMAANAENPRPDITLRGLIDYYVEQVLTPCLIPVGATRDETAPLGYGCARSYRGKLRNFVEPKWGNYGVREFERAPIRMAVQDWFKSLVRTRKKPEGYAPKYVRHIFEAMAQVCKYGVKLGYLNFNPLAEGRVELPRGSTKRLKAPTQLTVPEFFLLISKLTLLPRLVVAILGWLGPRFSEAFGLKWQNLDLKRGRVTFEQGFSEGRITDLKNEASHDTLPVPSEVLKLLHEWQSVTPYSKSSDWVFASPYTNGERPFYPASLMENHVRPIARQLGLPDFGWHGLRHSLSAWAKEAGLREDEITKLLRQDTSEMARLYGREGINLKEQLQRKVFAYVKRARAKRSSGRNSKRSRRTQRRSKEAA